jgi:hypothetical protein
MAAAIVYTKKTTILFITCYLKSAVIIKAYDLSSVAPSNPPLCVPKVRIQTLFCA